MQRAGKLAQAIDPESLACVIMVFVVELMHMETLLPHLVGDAKWHDFVQDRAAALICQPMIQTHREFVRRLTTKDQTLLPPTSTGF